MKPQFHYYEDQQQGAADFINGMVNYITTRICNDLDCDRIGQKCATAACTNQVCKIHRVYCSGCDEHLCPDCYELHLPECN